MSRKIIQIDSERCVGCGLCANACQQSAIEMVEGKAKVVRDDYCDGIGNCLPVCPVNAISFSDRDIINTKPLTNEGCPGNKQIKLERNDNKLQASASALNQWPVQIKLISPNADCFNGSDLLVAADCTAFSYGSFHNDFMKGKATIIGCPKLDEGDYADKLTTIIKENNINSMTVVRMEVPCCGGIERAAKTALTLSNKQIPFNVVTISLDGKILS